MTRYITVAVNGYVTVAVDDAADFDEAKAIAEAKVGEMDFGPLENVEWSASSGEDTNGERVEYDG